MTESYLPDYFTPLPFEPIHSGNFSVTLAQNAEEVRQAQALRYHVFVEEMKAQLPDEAVKEQRDFDAFDALCDHLLVRYHEGDATKIIGTYRLLRKGIVPAEGGFYSEDEYDISALLQASDNIVEVGRSCTHPEYRNKAAMQLLWRGIGEYVMHYNIDYLFGCASFEGTNPDDHAQSLSYLYHHHLADKSLRPHALSHHYVAMNRMESNEIDSKKAFFALPILVKGYLRLGGVVGDGAFIDHDFNTTDILMIVKTSDVSDKHRSRYAPDSVQGGDA